MKLSEIANRQVIEIDEEVEEATKAKVGGPVEVKDIVTNFPIKATKAIQALWGKDRLEYHGMKFFDGKEFGEAYDAIHNAVDEHLDEGFEVEESIPLDSDLVDAIDKKSRWNDFEFSMKIEKHDYQEVYLGYNPKNDHLVYGVDAWFNEDDFNEQWDKEFKENFGIDFEMDEETHHKLFMSVFEQYKKLSFTGIMFDLVLHGKEFKVVDSDYAANGFYQGLYKTQHFKSHGLVDLRLD
jgi:hypothetical protein